MSKIVKSIRDSFTDALGEAGNQEELARVLATLISCACVCIDAMAGDDPRLRNQLAHRAGDELLIMTAEIAKLRA